MNNEQQAKNGFKTFIITLAVSLIVFGSLYYFATGYSKEESIDTTPEKISGNVPASDESTVFKEIAMKEVDIPARAVLAGSDTNESTQTTGTPDTGSNEVAAIIISLTIVWAGIYILFARSRKYALSKFEKDVINRLK